MNPLETYLQNLFEIHSSGSAVKETSGYGTNRKISEYAPDGRTSETVFAIAGFSPGIQQGIATSLWVKTGNQVPVEEKRILFRDDLNTAKAAQRRADLLASLDAKDFDEQYEPAYPDETNRFSFRPSDIASHYKAWPSLSDLCRVHPFNGPVERRGFALIAMDKAILVDRMRNYFDKEKSDAEIEHIHPSLMMTGNRIVGPEARKKILKEFSFNPDVIVRYPFKPFDTRWCYLENLRPLFSEPSPQLLSQRFRGNAFLIVRETGVKEPTSPPFFYSQLVCDYHLLAVEAKHIPYQLNRAGAKASRTDQSNFFSADTVANLSLEASAFCESIGSGVEGEEAATIWLHALAIGYSPKYLIENADGIRGDWPRIPLPSTKDALLHSAELGRKIAALLDTEQAVDGVTAGTIGDPFKYVGTISHVAGKPLDPVEDLKVTAGWGHAGKGGVTMPGKGRIIERVYSTDERKAIERGAPLLGLTVEEALAHLGEGMCDVYLNDVAYWKGIPARVWDYTIGGYQVIKKWLSYRELELLSRPLTPDEAREVMNMARRIAAIVLLEPALDANYQAVKADTYS